MAERGWKQIDRLEGKDGTICAIKVNTESGTFKAEVLADGRYHAPFRECGEDLESIRAKAKKYLDDCTNLTWEPVIVVTPPKDPNKRDSWGHRQAEEEESLEFHYERYFSAKKEDGGRLWKDFDAKGDGPERDRLKGKAGETTSGPYGAREERAIIIPYTPEKWSAFRALTCMVQELNARIRRELTQDNVERFLGQVVERGMGLLLEGPKKGGANG